MLHLPLAWIRSLSSGCDAPALCPLALLRLHLWPVSSQPLLTLHTAVVAPCEGLEEGSACSCSRHPWTRSSGHSPPCTGLRSNVTSLYRLSLAAASKIAPSLSLSVRSSYLRPSWHLSPSKIVLSNYWLISHVRLSDYFPFLETNSIRARSIFFWLTAKSWRPES